MQPSLDLLCLVVLLLGPAPWCLGYAARQAAVVPARATALLALLVSWCMLQMVVALVLGFLGVFCLRQLMVAEALVFLTGLPVVGRSAPSTLGTLSALPRTWTEGALVLGIAVAGTSLLLRLAVTPITDYDSLAYHLPVMAKWYQTHEFVMLDQFSGGPARVSQVSRYPYGWEALSASFFMPFREDFLVALPNVMAWLIFGLGIHIVAVRLGARPLSALGFAFLALTAPIAREHVATMHVDLPLGAFFMAGLAFALGSVRNPVTAALFAATLGMLAGTKTSGLVYAACLAPTFGWTWLTESRGDRTGSRGWRAAILGGAALTAGGSAGLFWYIRNLVEIGNPLGFVQVVMAGVTVFAGPLDQETIASTTLWRKFHVTNLAHWAILLGQSWKALGFPFLFSLLAACGLRLFTRPRVRVIRRDALLIFMSLLAASTLAYVMTPFSATTWGSGPITPWMGQALRYAFPLIGLLAVGGALALSDTRVPDEVVVPLVVSAGLIRTSNRMMLPAACLFLLGWAVYRTTKARHRKAGRIIAMCLLGTLVCPASYVLQATRDAARARAYHGLAAFMARDVRPDEVVGYVLSHQSYLFYGTHFDRTVVYVPARGDDRATWIAELRARGVRFLALGPLRPEWRHRKEFGWVQESDGAFTPVFGRDAVVEPIVYRLERQRALS